MQHERVARQRWDIGQKPMRACRMGFLLMRRSSAGPEAGSYWLSAVLRVVNLVFRVPPSVLTMAMIASEMPAAIRPYSIAVAPDSSDRKLKNVRFNSTSAVL